VPAARPSMYSTAVYSPGSTGPRNASMRGVVMAARRRKSDRASRAAMHSPGRPTVAFREDRQRFWAAFARGLSSEQAAGEAGVSSAERIVPPGGESPRLRHASSPTRTSSREELSLSKGARTRPQAAWTLVRTPSCRSSGTRRGSILRGPDARQPPGSAHRRLPCTDSQATTVQLPRAGRDEFVPIAVSGVGDRLNHGLALLD
jgi:hypothetical protein